MKNRIFQSMLAAVCVLPLFVPVSIRAQLGEGGGLAAVEVEADKVEYLGDGTTFIATGNVKISRGVEVLTADRVTFNNETQDATASGNVHFKDDLRSWNGEELSYNFLTRQGSFPDMHLQMDPFHINAEESQTISAAHLHLKGVRITTCEPDDPEFFIKARQADVYNQRIIRLKGVRFNLRGVPFMYLPQYTVDLDREHTNFDFLPGFSSSMGVFALSAYTWYLNDDLKTTTHLDYRSKRGLAGGQDFAWKDSVDRRWSGFLKGYYAQDDRPYRTDSQEERLRQKYVEIEQQRYRLRLNHLQSLSDRDQLFVETGILSDARVVQDFFDEEYRMMPEQENRISYLHVDDIFTAGLELNHQFNDEFFDNVNRHPEATLEISRVPILDSPFYYEGYNSAAVLERAYNDYQVGEEGRENYDTQRIHTEHRIYYPTRNFGFLNLIPRVGYTGTFYGDTFSEEEQTELVTNVDSNGVVSVSSNSSTVVVSEGADTRSLPEIGLETTFKAFKVLHDQPVNTGMGLRHVLEPFADYTFIPEPDLRPGNIYQFDNIDRLDKRNDVVFGLRNKLQTRRRISKARAKALGSDVALHRIHDIVDASVWTTYHLDADADAGEEDLGEVGFDTELRLTSWMQIDFDGRFEPNESELQRFNSQVQFIAPDRSYLAIDHSYSLDRYHVVQTEYELNPTGRYGLEGYSRFEVEEGEFEEQVLMLTKKTDCVGYGLGARWTAGDVNPNTGIAEEDDWRAWAQIWLIALPKSQVIMGSR